MEKGKEDIEHGKQGKERKGKVDGARGCVWRGGGEGG